MTQAHIFYSGTVQGVGFRYTVQNYASQLDLKGWVKNLPDGRVEILVEGLKETVELLCQHVDEHFDGYIRDKEITFDESKGQFDGFKIEF